MIRWHGADAVREFLQRARRHWCAGSTRARWSATPISRRPNTSASISPISSASTSTCTTRRAFRRYIARLHNLAVDKPLVLTEFGVDSMRNGDDEQAQILSWQVRAAFAVRGRRHVRLRLDRRMVHRRASDRGLGFRPGRPRPPAETGLSRGRAAATRGRCRRRCRAIRGSRSWSAPTTPSARWRPASPRSRRSTIRITRSSSSMTGPRTARSKSPSGFPIAGSSARRTRGCSVARNVGAEAATGEIVAYTDSDCVADPDWLTYLVAKMEAGNLAACGGPEFPAAGGQPGAGRGRGVAGRPDACADQRRGRRAHRRLQHGVPPRRAAGAGRVRPAIPRRRRRRRHLLALPGCRLHDRLQRRPRWSGISAATR